MHQRWDSREAEDLGHSHFFSPVKLVVCSVSHPLIRPCFLDKAKDILHPFCETPDLLAQLKQHYKGYWV